MSIRYTTGQFRDALGLSKETFRYWKKNLPDLIGPQGNSSKFGPAELLATAILKHVNDQTGVPVGKLAGVAPELFLLCRQFVWPQLERSTVVFYFEENKVEFLASGELPKRPGTTILTPLNSVIEDLRSRLLEDLLAPQHNLVFPPHSVVAAGARR